MNARRVLLALAAAAVAVWVWLSATQPRWQRRRIQSGINDFDVWDDSAFDDWSDGR